MRIGEPATILVVEDEAIVAGQIQRSLATLGYPSPAIATSAEEAVLRASERCPDLVLMDMRIPGRRDGIETAELLRQRFEVPVIFLAGDADDGRAKRTEPFGTLLKPVTEAALQSAVESALYRRKMELRLSERDRRLSAAFQWDQGDPKKLHRQLEMADRLASLGTIAAGVAHEVNNALAVVQANATFSLSELRGHQCTWVESTIEALADLQIAASQIGGIVASLRALSQPAPSTPGRADIGRAIDWAIRATAHELRPRARLVTQLGNLPEAKADETRLGQVFVHLLLNAAQAIAPGEADRHQVRIVGRMDDSGRIAVEVADTGCGMPPEVLERIFEPFFTTRPGAGAGLGLSICRGIVASAGGELRVESQVGQGTVVCILLPRAIPEEPAATPPPDPAPAILRRGKILVVDDEPLVLKSVRRILGEHEVVCVESARAALGLLEAGERYDLIFCDLTMPAMSGVDFHEELLRSHSTEARSVVFLTGGPVTPRADDFLQSVPNLRVEKPFEVQSFRLMVRQLLAEAPRAS